MKKQIKSIREAKDAYDEADIEQQMINDLLTSVEEVRVKAMVLRQYLAQKQGRLADHIIKNIDLGELS